MSQLSIRLVGDNPYPLTVPDDVLKTIIREVVQTRIDDVLARHAAGEYPRDSVAFLVLDRTAPRWVPTDQTVLFVAAYGELGERFVRNAAAKAFEHRDHGVEAGALAKTMPGRLADGDFRFGCSALLDGTYVGVSGQEELQDRYQAIALANEFNHRIDSTRIAWHSANSGVWFSADNEPRARYQAVADLHGKELA